MLLPPTHPPLRHIHYLVPSIAATVVAVLVLLFREQQPIRRLVRLGGAWAPVVVPRVLALTTFLAGSILLFSGATPAVHGRLAWLDDFLPLPIVELSHFFGSIAGIGLLILARGIQRRLDAAYHLTIALLGAGILFSLLKAFDYEEAVVLGAMLLLFIPSRRYFYRRTSIIEERFTPRWIIAIGLVVLGSIALGFVSYGPNTFSGEMFWRFAFDAQRPRFLRATVGVAVALMAFAAARLIRPARPEVPLPTSGDLERARPIADACPDATAQLAMLGDKALLFDERATGFVMYGVQGRSWVAMGDPVAPAGSVAPLAERFAELAVRHGGWPVFYEVGAKQLWLYLDLGLSIVKLGEEARVALDDFTLEGPQRRNLRRVWRKAQEDGCTLEVVMPPCIGAVLPELRAVSDRWLEEKHAREKGFSLGFFDDRYVQRFPAGVVRREGRIVAFATVWPSGEHAELKVDLMRYGDGAPPGIMRYLLVELMLWGRQQGYHWFNLGMAPLSGLRRTALAPLWNQVGLALYGYGGRFYNFQGIRSFKEWFYPVWEPRYLASPGGASRPVILTNIASLIAGGLEGVVLR